MPLSIAALLIVGVSSADAATKRRVPVGDGEFRVKPRSFSTASIAPGQYDETSIRATRLRWRGWNGRQPTGRGRIRFCVADRGCETYRGRVVLRFPGAFGGCDTAIDFDIYRTVRFEQPDGTLTPNLQIIEPC